MTQEKFDPLLQRLLDDDAELAERVRGNQQRWQLAKQLLASRREAGLSQKRLAEATGMDQAQISRMESVTGPSPDPDSIHRYLAGCGFVSGYVWGNPRGGTLHVAGAVPLGTSAGEEEVFERLIGQDAQLSEEG
jgi:transcriptional regulator with XRE-family HTH domain